MDAPRFDAFTRALGTPGSRRGLLRTLLTLPVVGGLLAFFTADDTDAKGRRKRRKKRHKHGKGHGRHRKGKRNRRCKQKSRAKICAGKCGIVKNRKICKKRVDCGACACDSPCPVCQTCQEGITGPGVCVPDLAQVGEACGEPGQVCQADGACACDASSCPEALQFCADSACRLCLVDSCEPGNTSGCQYATLQEAVNDLDCPETLQLCAGTGMQTAPVHVPRNLTLAGAGAGQTILMGPSNGRVLQIAGEIEVTVQDLMVTGGAGGITNAGDLTLLGVAVTGNDAGSSGGGGIFNSGTGALTLGAGSRVAGNTAARGGGIRNGSVALTLKEGSVVGGDDPADANTAADEGGGIDNSGTLILENGSRVSGNTARDSGGGISNTLGTITLAAGSRVSGNSAAEVGGGIFSNGGTVTVNANALVCDNRAPQCSVPATIDNCPNPDSGVCP